MTSGSIVYHTIQTYIPNHSYRQVYMILKSSKQIFISYVYNTQLKDLWREIQRAESARQSSFRRRSMFSFWRLKNGGNFTEELKHVRNPKFTKRTITFLADNENCTSNWTEYLFEYWNFIHEIPKYDNWQSHFQIEEGDCQ